MEGLMVEYLGYQVPKEACTFNICGEPDDCLDCDHICRENEYDCDNCFIQKCFKKLGAYEKAEKEGRLHILPCNAGDSVYRINPGASDPIIEMMVQTIDIRFHKALANKKTVCLFCMDLKDGNETFYLEKSFGKDVFFTREEAFNAWADMQEGGAHD